MTIDIKKLNKYITYILLFYYQFCNYVNSGVGIWQPSVLLSTLIIGVLLVHVVATVFINKTNTLSVKNIMLFLLPYAVIMGLLNGAERSDMVFDLTIGCLLLLGLCLTNYEDKDILKLMVFLAVPSCLLSLFELSRTEMSTIDVLVSTREGLGETAIFHCATFFWLVNALVLSGFIYGKRYLIAALCFFINTAINLIATKRQFVVETAWLIIILMVVIPRVKGRLKNYVPIVLSIALVIGLSVFFVNRTNFDTVMLVEQQSDRFEEEAIESSGFIRFRESQNAFALSSPVSVFLGHGFGVPHHGISWNSNTHALHIGITNIIYQFGFWLIIPYLIMLVKSLRGLKNIKWLYENDKWRLISILVVLSQTPTFFLVGNYWTPTPTVTFFWYFLCRSLITKKINNDWENEKHFFKPAKASR